jgi:cytochrome P450
MVANLEPRIRKLSRQLLDQTIERGEMDLAADFSVPLAMKVIAGMIGIPLADWSRYRTWSDVILRLSYTRSGSDEEEHAMRDFTAVTTEMDAYLALSQQEILEFFQLLIVAGQETTTKSLCRICWSGSGISSSLAISRGSRARL